MGTFALPPYLPPIAVGLRSCSAFDAHWPPLQAWHLGNIRIASSSDICPLTYAKVEAERGACGSAMNAAMAGAVAAAECTIHSTHCTLYTLLKVHSAHGTLYPTCTVLTVHSTHGTLY